MMLFAYYLICNWTGYCISLFRTYYFWLPYSWLWTVITIRSSKKSRIWCWRFCIFLLLLLFIGMIIVSCILFINLSSFVIVICIIWISSTSNWILFFYCCRLFIGIIFWLIYIGTSTITLLIGWIITRFWWLNICSIRSWICWYFRWYFT